MEGLEKDFERGLHGRIALEACSAAFIASRSHLASWLGSLSPLLVLWSSLEVEDGICARRCYRLR